MIQLFDILLNGRGMDRNHKSRELFQVQLYMRVALVREYFCGLQTTHPVSAQQLCKYLIVIRPPFSLELYIESWGCLISISLFVYNIELESMNRRISVFTRWRKLGRKSNQLILINVAVANFRHSVEGLALLNISNASDSHSGEYIC